MCDAAAVLNFLLDFLFPRRSLTGEEGGWITDAEARSLRCAPVVLATPLLRSQGLDHIDRIVAAARYDRVLLLHRAIHTFKYRGVRGVGEVLGTMLVRASWLLHGEGIQNNELRIMNDAPVLCPVPLHWIRRFSRGFNQSEILARMLGRERGWEVRNLLRRARWTGSQVGRKREERLRGVRDAFAVRVQGIPQHVILVDDLSTTGATLDACAKVLKDAGVKHVEGLVIALG